MSNGFDIDIIIRPGLFPGLIDLIFGPGRRPSQPGKEFDGRSTPPGALSQAAPAPVSIPPPRIPSLPGTPPPIVDFPPTPAANQPFPRFPSLGKLLGVGGFIITAAEILVQTIENRQLKSMGDILEDLQRRIDEQIARRKRERAAAEADLRTEKRAAALENAPETFDPTPIPPQVSPEIQSIPSAFPGVFVGDFPTAPPASRPSAQPFPASLPAPVSIPSPSLPPVVAPVSLPLPEIIFTPVQIPRLTVFDPVIVTSPLSATPTGQTLGFADVSVQDFPTPQTAPQTDPAKCRPRKCRDDPDDPRTECFKGLYVEGRIDTDFVQWAKVDCETGVQID